jgi:glycerol-3-phosphate dehydrogenase
MLALVCFLTVGLMRRGSAIARFVGVNIGTHEEFHPICKMWVFEETFEGRKLTEIINTDHENRKYLPGFKLPDSIVAGMVAACCGSVASSQSVARTALFRLFGHVAGNIVLIVLVRARSPGLGRSHS